MSKCFVDLYDPGDESRPECEIEIIVEFHIQPVEQDVGIMSAYPEDICPYADTPLGWLPFEPEERFNSVIEQRLIDYMGEDYDIY